MFLSALLVDWSIQGWCSLNKLVILSCLGYFSTSFSPISRRISAGFVSNNLWWLILVKVLAACFLLAPYYFTIKTEQNGLNKLN